MYYRSGTGGMRWHRRQADALSLLTRLQHFSDVVAAILKVSRQIEKPIHSIKRSKKKPKARLFQITLG